MNTANDIAEIQKENMTSSSKQNMKIILSNADECIRSNWLRSWIIFFVGRLFLDFGPYFYLTYQGSVESNEAFKNCLFVAAGTFAQCGLLFFFAYLLDGTKWIGFFVFYAPISLFNSFTQVFTEFTALGLASHQLSKLFHITATEIFYILTISLVLMLVYGYFWINSLNLYELNHTIKKR